MLSHAQRREMSACSLQQQQPIPGGLKKTGIANPPPPPDLTFSRLTLSPVPATTRRGLTNQTRGIFSSIHPNRRIGNLALVFSSMATQTSRMRMQAMASRTKFNQMLHHGLASRTSPRLKVKTDSISPLYRFGGVHGGASHQKTWRNKPLFRREVCYREFAHFCRVELVRGLRDSCVHACGRWMCGRTL